MLTDKIKLWWRIIRPKTLFASLCPVACAYIATGYKKTGMFVAVLFCALCLQVLSNLINDYYDYKKGTDKKGRIGFKRALAEGTVSVAQMKKAVYICLALCLFLGLFLVLKGGLPVLAIGLTSLLFAWLYTATSVSLSYLGIADIFVFVYYGIIPFTGTAYLLTDDLSSFVNTDYVFLGAINGLISSMVLMINNIRDEKDDALSGKKTVVVRMGRRFAYLLLTVYALLAAVFAYASLGLSLVLAVPVLMLLLCVKASDKKSDLNRCLFYTGLINMIYVLLLGITLSF
ncbi:MAG: 1,4-dihydroxy-2-naphthoate octaprenyltransferase [Bacteroidales bacterium]|nr:1,4-dihydroxy-2-naphthoate octaprenyltransferase [Bacteroidales bacterium]